MRAILCGQRRTRRSYHITTNVDEQPPESTGLLMPNRPGTIKQTVGHTYGWRTWIAYGFQQRNNEVGWADFRFTAFPDMEQWWEIVCRASLMVS
jgi:SRSO17 transposase